MTIITEPIKDAARRAAGVAIKQMPDQAPRPIAPCKSTPDPVVLQRKTAQRQQHATRIFPGQQHYGDGGLLCAAQIIQQLTRQKLNEPELLAEAICDGNAQRENGEYSPGSMPSDPELLTLCGNTTPASIAAILKKRGVDSLLSQPTIGNLETALESKKAVIVSVDVSKFWQHKGQFPSRKQFILITNGSFDQSGQLTTVTVNDTGSNEVNRAVSIDELSSAVLDEQILITKVPIWP